MSDKNGGTTFESADPMGDDELLCKHCGQAWPEHSAGNVDKNGRYTVDLCPKPNDTSGN